MKNNRHEKAPSAPTLEAYEAVNISEDIHMTKHTEVNEKLNAGAVKGPVTAEHLFASCNVEKQELFAVRPGIPATDALDEASCILSELKSSLEGIAMGTDGVNPDQVWILVRSVGLAKAVVDSTRDGLGRFS